MTQEYRWIPNDPVYRLKGEDFYADFCQLPTEKGLFSMIRKTETLREEIDEPLIALAHERSDNSIYTLLEEPATFLANIDLLRNAEGLREAKECLSLNNLLDALENKVKNKRGKLGRLFLGPLPMLRNLLPSRNP